MLQLYIHIHIQSELKGTVFVFYVTLHAKMKMPDSQWRGSLKCFVGSMFIILKINYFHYIYNINATKRLHNKNQKYGLGINDKY